MTVLPLDNNHYPIPALRLRAGGAHTVNATASSARNVTAFDEDTRIISIYATQDVFVKFGDETVTATSSDHFFPACVYYNFAIGGTQTQHNTHIAILRAGGADGAVYLSEKH